MSFEKKLDELEKLVKTLESGDISLESGVELYEKGLELTRDCLKSLTENKGKITLIKKEMNKLIEEPLEQS